MSVIRPPPPAFLCFCGGPVVCQLPHLLCRPHAIAFYQSLVETGAALAWLTRAVPLNLFQWLPLPAKVLVREPDVFYATGRRHPCVRPGCTNRRGSANGKLCTGHLAALRSANAQYGILARKRQHALKAKH